ncbi:aliphatic sulfonate ABC transporter substrate-binding protein [Tianweitania sp. BSSL-BM11]|uniref:Aliphatic sulfonate ABC transporter substrate-binding protein n=1 Tax=Tianweitania aestuarii TaxID=2814886 RepID=A0ABS5S0T4_9HYPH|nr:substrate-binding domain-containing protein [Tianweitania aestuarii]MBS9722069.1 aliphatic sulfonate ABC transporter substrate-binding protein [Tianweitania aestuarii]
MPSRRSFLKTSAAVAAFGLAMPATIGRAQSATNISVGYIADFPNASVLAIADNQKLWEAEGLTADAKVFTNGPIQIQAMGAGSLDFGTIGPGALWLPASGRAKVISVNDIGFSDRVIAQPDIASIDQLKGKKVGVPQGTSGDMILRLALEKAGMTVNDIDMVPMDPSTVVAAFASRQIEAAGIWYPLITVIKKQVPEMKELAANADFYPDTSFINTLVARNEVVDQDPEKVKKFLSVMKKAIDWRAANLDESIELTTAYLNAPKEAVENVARSRKLLTSQELETFTKDGTVESWLDQFNKMFVEFGQLKEAMPPKEFYTADLFLSA